jgi:LPXTG-site transpeptidase (sortase) family protein
MAQNQHTTHRTNLGVLAVIMIAVGLLAGLSVGPFAHAPTPTEKDSKAATSTSPQITFASSTEPITPQTLQIPKIGVDASIEQVGVNNEGNMANPSNWRNVSWYEPGFAPGESGNAVFAGHLDWDENQAVFWDLDKLTAGDVVRVAGKRDLTYVVTTVNQYDYQLADTESVFGDTKSSQIKLITCDGEFIEGSDTYNKRLIVTAQLAETSAGEPIATSTESVAIKTQTGASK